MDPRPTDERQERCTTRLLRWLRELPAWGKLLVVIVVGFLALQAVNLWATSSVDNEDCLVTVTDC